MNRWNSTVNKLDVSAPNGNTITSSCPDASCAVANLDMQYIMAIGKGAATTFTYMDGGIWDHFLMWVYAAVGSATPQDVHSISYGSHEISVDELTMHRCDAAQVALFSSCSLMLSRAHIENNP